MPIKKTTCDECNLAKTPIIYLRMSRKLCLECFKLERETLKSLIRTVKNVKDRPAPLGYNFIVNDWFSDESKGRMYANHVFNNFSVSLS